MKVKDVVSIPYLKIIIEYVNNIWEVVDVAIIDTPPINRKISFRIALSFRSGLASAAWNSRSRKANLFSNIKMGFLMLVQKCRIKNIFLLGRLYSSSSSLLLLETSDSHWPFFFCSSRRFWMTWCRSPKNAKVYYPSANLESQWSITLSIKELVMEMHCFSRR
jgi:hypothetical protein